MSRLCANEEDINYMILLQRKHKEESGLLFSYESVLSLF